MAEAIVISTESDVDDLSKESVKVRNAASEGILSFFSVLPAGELPTACHTSELHSTGTATEGNYKEKASRPAKKTPRTG